MDKSSIKIIFMGTPSISAQVFERMILDGYHFVGLVAQPDRPVGRKKILEPVPAKKVAEKYNIPVFQPLKIRHDYDFLKELKPDLIITLAYGQIVPQGVLDIPQYGCLNLHGSLLPKYRGASPIQAALINDENVTGVTLMEMTAKMDAGRMYAKEIVNIDPKDNSTSLFEKISLAAGDLILRELPNYLDNKLIGEPQNEDEATFCYTIKDDEEKLNLENGVHTLLGWIRALSEEPGAYLYFDNEILKIYDAAIANDKVEGQVGEIVKADKNGLYLQCKDGQLALLSLKQQGKNKMDYKSFINGHQNILGKTLK